MNHSVFLLRLERNNDLVEIHHIRNVVRLKRRINRWLQHHPNHQAQVQCLGREIDLLQCPCLAAGRSASSLSIGKT